MALFPFLKKKQTQEVQFTPTFIPLELVNAWLSNSLDANQRKFLELYLSVPELQAIINYKARIFAGMRVKAVNEAGDEKDIPQLNLFAQPNPLQNFKEFSTQYYVLRAIFGNEFIHPVFGKKKDNVQAMWNLPPMGAEVVPVKNDKIPFNMTEIDELIEKYKFQYQGSVIEYQPEEIIHFNDNQVQFEKDKILLGDSKIRPLTQACENIKNAYEARGILITNSALGVLSNETTDGMGRIDISPTEKSELQEDFRKQYGLTRKKANIIMTNANLKWQSMTTDVGRLKLHDEVDTDFRTIANAHNFPPEVLQTSSTYENKQKAIVQLYQEAIIPEADEWLQGMGNWMELDVTLKSDFSHIAVLQADLERRSRALNQASSGLSKAVQSGILEQSLAEEEMKKYLI